LIPSLAASQGTALARVDDVRAVETRESCYGSGHAAPDAQSVTRVRGSRADTPWPSDSAIMANDRLVVATKTDVRLRVDGPTGRGRIVLVPSLGRCPGSDVGRHIAGRTPPSGTGSYEFKKDTAGRGANAPERFILTVRNGAAVVQWKTGQLQVRALDEQIGDVGSSFSVVVDSAARKGIVTVQQGLVTLRSGTVAAGQSFVFGPGQPLQPVVVRTAGLDEIRFHTDDMWKNGRSLPGLPSVSIPHPSMGRFGSLPWKPILVTGFGIGGATYATMKLWPKKGPPAPPPVKAIVVITLPL
jgi:hypothetical protein